MAQRTRPCSKSAEEQVFTPQHVIDEESHPGVLADMLHPSSSSSSSSSSSDSDSDGSSKSHSTAKRIKRVLRGRRRRKSSASSKDTPSAPSILRTPSANTFSHGIDNSESAVLETHDVSFESIPQHLGIIASGDEADTDGESRHSYRKAPDKTIKSRDFEKGKRVNIPRSLNSSSPGKKAKKGGMVGQQQGAYSEKQAEIQKPETPKSNIGRLADPIPQTVPRISLTLEESSRRPFGKLGISNVLPAIPAMPRVLSTTVFSAANPTGLPAVGPSATMATTSPLHRSTSLPSRLNRIDGAGPTTAAPQTVPYVRPVTAMNPTFDGKDSDNPKKHLSRTSAVLLLLASTGLVAVCAEFLVASINYLVDNTSVSEAFIGLIVLPIVGNAAEHVTAVTVASKNKMDLAIGVAVGSSIQIALFVTPVIVLLGWALQKDMSLYFSLFETISLFVSAFIINFLILDGKTNYLEGASPQPVPNPRNPPNPAAAPPFLAKSKKRALSKLPATLSILSGQPPSKKPRHRPRSQKAIDRSTRLRPPHDESRLSPSVFLDDRSAIRPTLPFRLSSSDADHTMLGKGAKDDSGAVRTLKLARGSLKLGNLARSAGSPSARSSASASAMDVDEVHSSPGLSVLGQIGVTEFLEQDERPTFVIDLAEQANFEPGPLNIVFANVALRASGGLQELICRKGDQDSPGLAAATAFSDFKAWATSYVRNHTPLDVGLPSFFFLGITWTCCTLRKRLRLIKGVPGSAAGSTVSNPPSVGFPNSFVSGKDGHRHTSSIYEMGKGTQNEPLDYFGNFKASLPAVASPTQAKPGVTGQATPSEASMSAGKKGGKKLSRKSEDGLLARSRDSTSKTPPQLKGAVPPSPLRLRYTEAILGAAAAGEVDSFSTTMQSDSGFFDWTRLPVSAALPPHIQFARSIDWGATKLGPIEEWSSELRSMCNLIMASPHPAAMYWGEDLVAIYNEAYILLAGQKHPTLMGQSYRDAWEEIWDDVKDVFADARSTGQATMKDDDRLFMQRSGAPGFLEETYFSWSIIPLVGADGSVVGLYNPAFEKTRRKIAERRMLTLREVGEKTAAARDLEGFWQQVLKGLQYNEYDAPFVMIYSVADDTGSDVSSYSSGFVDKHCTLQGTLGVPEGHQAAPAHIDLRTGNHSWGPVFREAMKYSKPLYLQTENGTLDPGLLHGIDWRGFGDESRAAVCCPIHLTGGDSILGFLLMGVNPRRPYDDDYSLFVQLLGRQLTTSVASVVLFEEEIARGRRAAQLAALDRIELSEQLAIRTQEAAESETKFTRMAEFAPVGIFIADNEGRITYCNDTWYEISHIPKATNATTNWMDFIRDEDKAMVETLWFNLVHNTSPMNAEFRFRAQWEDQKGHKSDTWVLASAFPEKNSDGSLKIIFGSITNISQQKWAEHLEKRKMEEALEMKRQQENFIDITSHEMRNPLSAILQCADEISNTLKEYRSGGAPATKSLDDLLDSNIDAAQTIALCAQHQKRIVDDILTLSKLDSALLLVTPCDVMPVSVVQRALKMFDGEVQTARIKLNFRIDDSFKRIKAQWVRLDPSRLLQVLINLTTNAIKFTTTQAKRIITVTLGASLQRPSQTSGFNQVSYFPTRAKRKDLTESPDWGSGEKCYLYFAVQDTGRGLSEDETKLLFHRFSQASPRTHVQYGGSGLGLFISRELVELQGGEIGVSSRSGEGSTFAFYITCRRSTAPREALDQMPAVGIRQEKAPEPVPARPSRSSAASPQGRNPAPKSELKVLIVEDNLVNQRVLQRQLRNIGCTVLVANHGKECLARLQESNFWRGHGKDAPDLGVILVDLEMPVMDGLTCAREIRKAQQSGEIVRHVPIIAVTANARSEQIETALAAGM
ncbi:MAG: hypothetical protein Q9225_005579, partial [Loekoesia sp. 1 TL-2023]